MITIIARFRMLPGKEVEATEALKKMAAAVEAEEPGALVYIVNRGRVNPLEICVYEVYRDSEAAEAHRRTPHMREMQAAFAETMDRASFSVETLEQIAGFVRR